MEGHCSTCQSPQWAVVPIEEEKEDEEEEEEEEDEESTLNKSLENPWKEIRHILTTVLSFTAQNTIQETLICLIQPYVSRDSSVGIATRYGLDGQVIESRWWRDFPHLSRLALGPTQPPV